MVCLWRWRRFRPSPECGIVNNRQEPRKKPFDKFSLVGEKSAAMPRSKPSFQRSDHCDGRRFFNPGGETAPRLGGIMRWQLERLFRPAAADPGPVERFWPAGETAGEPGRSVSFLGHASFLLRGPGWSALLDPVCSATAGVWRLGVKRLQPSALGLDQLPDPDFVLVTHNHYDHCDVATLRHLSGRPSRPVAVVPLGNGKLMKRMGFGHVVELDWWEVWRPARGPVVTLTPAVHFSSRGPFDRNRTLWGGFHLRDGDRALFAAGDTAYGKHFRETRERLGAPSLALLPIGAYLPSRLMRPIHQGPREALQAHEDLGAQRSLAFHFGAFPLADDSLHGPAQELRKLLQESGTPKESFLVPGLGDELSW